jgi:hypothetical protein
MEGVNSAVIYYKNFCKCHSVPQKNNNNNKHKNPQEVTTGKKERKEKAFQSLD